MSEVGSLWSRRRAAVAAEAQAEEAKAQEQALQVERADKTDAEILAELDLPDPDSLKMGDDFAAFMARAVPEHLRKRALRKLWRSNPVLACVDGLNDYDDDYLTGSTGNGKIATTYQVGKGLLSHVLEMERQQRAADAPDEVLAEAPEALDTQEQIADAPEAGAFVAADADPEPEMPAATEPEQPILQVPRRMQFQFEGDSA